MWSPDWTNQQISWWVQSIKFSTLFLTHFIHHHHYYVVTVFFSSFNLYSVHYLLAKNWGNHWALPVLRVIVSFLSCIYLQCLFWVAKRKSRKVLLRCIHCYLMYYDCSFTGVMNTLASCSATWSRQRLTKTPQSQAFCAIKVHLNWGGFGRVNQ